MSKNPNPMLDGHEQVCLSAMMNGHADLPVSEDDFSFSVNRPILAAIQRLDKNRGLLAVCDELQRRGQLAAVGGRARLTIISDMPHDPVSVEYALGEVLEASRERQAAKIGEALHKGGIGLVEAEKQLAELNRRTATNGTRISFRSPSAILAMPRNPKANFLGDRLLGVARSLVLAGIGGLGKSRLLLQLLVALILERIWCSIETHHTKGRPWMLVQTQNSTDRLQDDLEPLKQYAGRDWPLVEENLLIHTLETDRDLMLHLSDPQNARDLENAIRDYDPIGVAFDPLNEISIGNLNDDVDMSATCREIGRVSRAGNPERAIVVLTHAITGMAGMKKAFGFEAAGFGRNSKVLQMWTRAQINIIPGTDDHSVLVLTCGKLNDGKQFSPFAVHLNPDTMIYEPEPDFDIEGLREHIESSKNSRTAYQPQIVGEMDWPKPELDKKQLAEAIQEETNCSRPTAYRLIDAAVAHRIIKFSKLTRIYAKK